MNVQLSSFILIFVLVLNINYAFGQNVNLTQKSSGNTTVSPRLAKRAMIFERNFIDRSNFIDKGKRDVESQYTTASPRLAKRAMIFERNFIDRSNFIDKGKRDVEKQTTTISPRLAKRAMIFERNFIDRANFIDKGKRDVESSPRLAKRDMVFTKNVIDRSDFISKGKRDVQKNTLETTAAPRLQKRDFFFDRNYIDRSTFIDKGKRDVDSVTTTAKPRLRRAMYFKGNLLSGYRCTSPGVCEEIANTSIPLDVSLENLQALGIPTFEDVGPWSAKKRSVNKRQVSGKFIDRPNFIDAPGRTNCDRYGRRCNIFSG